MNYKWTIRYQAGTYSDEYVVYTEFDDSEVAIAKMWKALKPGAWYLSASIVSCEELN